MADYYDMKDRIRREGMAEQKSKFLETAGSKDLPSRAAGLPKAVIAGLEEKSLPPTKEYGETATAWMGSPKELKQGTGGYVYEYDPSDDSYTIVKTKGGVAPAKAVKITRDHPAFDDIQNDVSRVAQMQLEGKWDVEKNAPRVGASPVYAGKPAASKAAPKKSAPAAIKGAAAMKPAKAEMDLGEETIFAAKPSTGMKALEGQYAKLSQEESLSRPMMESQSARRQLMMDTAKALSANGLDLKLAEKVARDMAADNAFNAMQSLVKAAPAAKMKGAFLSK